MTQSHYLVDYARDGYAGSDVVTLYPDTLADAKKLARKYSKAHGAAYVIRCTYPTRNAPAVQHGQLVYYDGRQSHTDDAFATSNVEG